MGQTLLLQLLAHCHNGSVDLFVDKGGGCLKFVIFHQRFKNRLSHLSTGALITLTLKTGSNLLAERRFRSVLHPKGSHKVLVDFGHLRRPDFLHADLELGSFAGHLGAGIILREGQLQRHFFPGSSTSDPGLKFGQERALAQHHWIIFRFAPLKYLAIYAALKINQDPITFFRRFLGSFVGRSLLAQGLDSPVNVIIDHLAGLTLNRHVLNVSARHFRKDFKIGNELEVLTARQVLGLDRGGSRCIQGLAVYRLHVT